LSNGVTQEDRVSAALDVRVQAARLVVRQILTTVRLSCDGEGMLVPKFLISHCLEKLLARIRVPVPQTDTGRRGENPKVIERTLVKELGKMTP
jgi:hypothetical protein